MQAHRFPSPSQSQPRRRPYATNRRRDAEEAEFRQAIMVWIWFVIAAKVIALIALVCVAVAVLHPASHMLTFAVLLNWSWVLLGAILAIGPALYWYRLRRARRKRAALIHAEWHVD
ncbi:MAG: hypothetical protein ACTHMJ_01480 [Thermomicrobiales bacterium]